MAAELIQETESQKTLRMVITFGKVNADNFYSALSERLKPQMKTVRICLSRSNRNSLLTHSEML